MDALGGYQEVSPSGTGVHIIVKGKLPEGRSRRGKIEAYSRERFFTFTGVAV
jgi:putative DNA primase/helicase